MTDDTMTEKEMHDMLEEAEALHSTWWAMAKYFEKHGRDINNLAGYDDIQLMNEFCEMHPEIVRVHVDDDYHCNSWIYLIPHESDNRYMGSTALFIPQCCGVINRFFLYPNDHRQMINAMRELERKFWEKGDNEWRRIYGEFDG